MLFALQHTSAMRAVAAMRRGVNAGLGLLIHLGGAGVVGAARHVVATGDVLLRLIRHVVSGWCPGHRKSIGRAGSDEGYHSEATGAQPSSSEFVRSGPTRFGRLHYATIRA